MQEREATPAGWSNWDTWRAWVWLAHDVACVETVRAFLASTDRDDVTVFEHVGTEALVRFARAVGYVSEPYPDGLDPTVVGLGAGSGPVLGDAERVARR